MIKLLIKFIVDSIFIKVAKYFIWNTKYTAIDKVWKDSIDSSANYIKANSKNTLLFPIVKELWDYGLSISDKDGYFLEFGVWKGKSINYFSKKLPDITFYGFDSFQGLKENWHGTSVRKGHFNLNNRLPKVNKNVNLIEGWFNDSIPIFLDNNNNKISFLHIDCDTNESTRTILELLKNRITKNTILIFDEYFGYPEWENGEFLAWKEFVKSNNIRYKYLAFSNKQVLIKVL